MLVGGRRSCMRINRVHWISVIPPEHEALIRGSGIVNHCRPAYQPGSPALRASICWGSRRTISALFVTPPILPLRTCHVTIYRCALHVAITLDEFLVCCPVACSPQYSALCVESTGGVTKRVQILLSKRYKLVVCHPFDPPLT